jgi:DNA-binding NarL/FixJ family response regulator
MEAILGKPLEGCGVIYLALYARFEPGPSAPRAPRTLIADDHVPTRARVRVVLEQAGFEVCAEAGNARAAVKAAVRERPDICLLDINMPGGGITAAAEIRARLPETLVVMLTVSSDEKDISESLRAGATGYLLKDMDFAQIPATLRAALAGEPTPPRGL